MSYFSLFLYSRSQHSKSAKDEKEEDTVGNHELFDLDNNERGKEANTGVHGQQKRILSSSPRFSPKLSPKGKPKLRVKLSEKAKDINKIEKDRYVSM